MLPKSSLKTYIRHFIRALLFAGFLVAVITSVQQLLNRETGISLSYSSEDCPLPTLSICPYFLSSNGLYPNFTEGQGNSFHDFYLAMKDTIGPLVDMDTSTVWIGKGKTASLTDLVDIKHFLSTNEFFSLVKCAEIRFRESQFSSSQIGVSP